MESGGWGFLGWECRDCGGRNSHCVLPAVSLNVEAPNVAVSYHTYSAPMLCTMQFTFIHFFNSIFQAVVVVAKYYREWYIYRWAVVRIYTPCNVAE